MDIDQSKESKWTIINSSRIQRGKRRVMAKEDYYGMKYGTFSWVRGTIDIYDLDDLKYVAICLKKMRKRLRSK